MEPFFRSDGHYYCKFLIIIQGKKLRHSTIAIRLITINPPPHHNVASEGISIRPAPKSQSNVHHFGFIPLREVTTPDTLPSPLIKSDPTTEIYTVEESPPQPIHQIKVSNTK